MQNILLYMWSVSIGNEHNLRSEAQDLDEIGLIKFQYYLPKKKLLPEHKM